MTDKELEVMTSLAEAGQLLVSQHDAAILGKYEAKCLDWHVLRNAVDVSMEVLAGERTRRRNETMKKHPPFPKTACSKCELMYWPEDLTTAYVHGVRQKYCEECFVEVGGGE